MKLEVDFNNFLNIIKKFFLFWVLLIKHAIKWWWNPDIITVTIGPRPTIPPSFNNVFK